MNKVYSTYYNYRIVDRGKKVTWLVSNNLEFIYKHTDKYSLATLVEVNEYVLQCDPCAFGEIIEVQEGVAK